MAVSGAFSGLLTGVITDNLAIAHGIEGWQWLFLIKGLGMYFLALFTWMILPDWLMTTRWMTAKEKMRLLPTNCRSLSDPTGIEFIAVQCLKHDSISGVAIGDKPMHKECLKMVLMDWCTWYLSMMYMLATGSQTIQYFIPTLIGQLSYSGVARQYMTIPIYMVALICILMFCFLSDIKKDFIIVVAVNAKKVKYVFLCFAVECMYVACPLTLLWVSSVIDHPAENRLFSLVGTHKVLLRKYPSQGLNNVEQIIDEKQSDVASI
ncbi:hypothetical protein EDD85DRAFT_951714 [Armillaria nabsnona]|nr:hypothetical protein EDD85DRAFT_951714 [Armillaria nabsnona]